MEFFKQYTIKGEKDPIGTEEEFLRLRNGACIVKSTGEEYIKQEDHVFNKSSRQFYSKVETDNNFASLSKQNTFLDKQLTNVAITDSNQLTTKAYVDKTVNDAKVDTSVFANIHKANIFDEIQTCAEKPSSRAHLVNKAYVDDSIDNIVFDTSNLANVNKSNTFTDPQTCLADPLNQYHLTNKKYVDAAIAQVNGDTSTFVRYNTKNHFEDDQTFNYRLILNHEPTEKNDVVTLNYLNKKVEGLNLSQYAKLNERNTFTEDQTFSGYAYCNNRPVFDNQLANKKYVDDSLGNISVSGAVAYTNKDNQFSVQQTFLAPVVIQNPVSDNNPTTKQYVDSKIQSAGIAYANTEVQGTVKLSYGLDSIKTDVPRVPTESQVATAVQNITTSIRDLDAMAVKKYGTNFIPASNTFVGENLFEKTIDGVTVGTLSFCKDIDGFTTIESRWYYNNNADFGLQHVRATYPTDDSDPLEVDLGTTRLVSSGSVFTLTTATDLGYGTDNNFVPDKSALAFWNGAYNANNQSNLKYCYQGEIIGSNNIAQQSVNYANTCNKANIATNANRANQLAKSVNIGLSGVVQGSASFNGANNITIKTTSDLESTIMNNMVGDAKEGQVLSAIFDTTKNQNVVTSYPLIEFCKIANTAEILNQLKLVPVGMSTIFSEWYRFSHWRSEQNLSGNTGHMMPNNTYSGVEHAAARNGWTYDKSTNMIKSNRNSPVYAGFINPLRLKQWYLKVQIYGGGDGDNDGILINVAFMKDSNGVEHTIDLVRARSGVGNGVYLDDKKGMEFYWSLVYDYRQDTQKELANNPKVYCAPTSGYGWGTNYACMSCQRNVTNIKCYTSDVVSTPITTVNENSLIDYTLPSSKPSDWSDAMWSNMQTMLLNASQMGVGAHSQNGLFTILEQRYIFNDEKIYDMVNDIIWEYSEKTNNWNNVGKCSASLREGQIYYNESTKQTFYYTNGNAFCIGNGN